MIKRICAFFIFIFLLTGCGKESTVLLQYKNNTSANEVNINFNYDLSVADLFAKNLCVIPSNTDNMQDGNLLARSTLLVDVTSRNMIYANNIYERLYPASITKIVTAYVTLKYGDLSSIVTISDNAVAIKQVDPEAKVCGFQAGDQIKLEDLLSCFLVYSGNDAGIAIAEHISGSEEAFIAKMNEEAKLLGCVDSNFMNSHGLHDENHYTTAYDVYLVFQELIKDERFANMIHQTSVTFNYKNKSGTEITSKQFTTTNQYLLGYISAPEEIQVMGGKTGTTNEAGNCLVLYSKQKEQKPYISIIMNATTRDGLYAQMTYLLQQINK